MEDFKNEIIVYSGVCRCCLQDVNNESFMGLWDEYLNEGNVEVYGQMITESFKIPWVQPKNPDENVEQICVDCVLKVREIFSFKKQLQAVDKQLAQHFQQAEEMTIKPEVEENMDGNEYKSPDEPHMGQVLEGINEDKSINEDQVIYSAENLMDILENSDTEYEDIEYIEEEEDWDVTLKEMDDTKEEPQVRQRKWPKKKRKGEGTRIVKNYRPVDMENAVRAALDGALSHAQAAARYGVPRKTVDAKVRKRKIEIEEERLGIKRPNNEKSEDHIDRVRMTNLINDIMKILTYTNATPYKTTTSNYGCVYCDYVLKATTFEDPEQLRAHTRVQHADHRIQAIDNVMKPYNEVLKVDIYNLVCTVCCVAITGWMEMFEHLLKVHDVVLDEAYTRVIPYVLDFSSYKCAICKEKFHNYHHLDTHINCHYNNYVCEDCGDTFLTRTRIKAHMKVHKTGRYACEHPGCGKVFNLERYMKKHYMFVHTDEKKVRCPYCNLKFHDEVQKHHHTKEHHEEKITYITCDLCGMVFDWKNSYYTHMRKKHKNDYSIKCKHCDVLCTNKALLKKHMRAHGDTGNYCEICDKSYSTHVYLKQHKKRVHDIDSSPLSVVEMGEEDGECILPV